MRLCNERRERVYFIMARVPRRVPLTPPVYNDRREKTGNVCLYTILHVVKSLPAVWPERMFQRAPIRVGSISAFPERFFSGSGTLISLLTTVRSIWCYYSSCGYQNGRLRHHRQEPLVPVYNSNSRVFGT